MNLNRIYLLLFVLALVAVPAAADCGAPHGDDDGHGHAAIASKACCAGAAEGTGCGPECPHAQEALKLAEAAEGGDTEAMAKLVAMVKESGHEEAITLAGKAEGGCEASQSAMIAMIKEHVGGAEAQTASMTDLAQAAGKGCAKSTAKLIAAAKESGDPKMADLASRAEGGCEHSKAALIAMVSDGSKTDGE